MTLLDYFVVVFVIMFMFPMLCNILLAVFCLLHKIKSDT